MIIYLEVTFRLIAQNTTEEAFNTLFEGYEAKVTNTGVKYLLKNES